MPKVASGALALLGMGALESAAATRSDAHMALEHTGPTTELLQALIRNQCVNNGKPESGGEVRNAELLETYLAGTPAGIQQFESIPGRGRTSATQRVWPRRRNRPECPWS